MSQFSSSRMHADWNGGMGDKWNGGMDKLPVRASHAMLLPYLDYLSLPYADDSSATTPVDIPTVEVVNYVLLSYLDILKKYIQIF